MPSPMASMSEVIGVGCGACGVCVCGVSIKGPSNDEIFLIVFLFPVAPTQLATLSGLDANVKFRYFTSNTHASFVLT